MDDFGCVILAYWAVPTKVKGHNNKLVTSKLYSNVQSLNEFEVIMMLFTGLLVSKLLNIYIYISIYTDVYMYISINICMGQFVSQVLHHIMTFSLSNRYEC